MIAMAKCPGQASFEGSYWPVLHHRDAGRIHQIEQSSRRSEGAQTVIGQIYLHAMTLTFNQRIGEHLANSSVGKYIHLYIDVISGSADCCQHRTISLSAVLEQCDLVVGDQRYLADRLLKGKISLENIGRDFLMRLSLLNGVSACAGVSGPSGPIICGLTT